MRKLCLFLFFFTIQFLYAQPDTLWTKSYGINRYNNGQDIIQTSDFGYMIVGSTYSNNWDILVLKTDGRGDTLWTKIIGGSNDDSGYSIIEAENDSYIIVGNTHSYGNGGLDAWILKINSFGDTIWTKTYGGINNDDAIAVENTSDGGYIVCGRTNSFGNGSYDIWLLKIDSRGDSLWMNTFGSSNYESGKSIKATPDGGYIITGYQTSGTWGFEPADAFLIKIDSNGNQIWNRNFRKSNYNWATSVLQTLDYGYLLGGTCGQSEQPPHDIFIIKTDSNGDSLWSKIYNDSLSRNCSSISHTLDGDYIICGSINLVGTDDWDTELIKIDEFGDVDWKVVVGDNYHEIGNKIIQTIEGDYVVTGRKHILVSDTSKVWLVKISGFLEKPILFSIQDVQNDQGGWVTVHFAKSLYDTDTLIHPVSKAEYYTVEENYDSIWTAVGSTVAYGKSYYSVLVPTIKDSTMYSNGLIDFRVIAGMDEGNFVSNILSGYSVDNLTPNAPQNLSGYLIQDTVASLVWSSNQEEDFQYYSVFRSTDGINFESIYDLTDTTYIDTFYIAADSLFYGIKAVDYSGNHSTYSNFVTFILNNIPNEGGYNLDFRLHQNYPNPFNPKTKIIFDLPELKKVRIDIFNVLGQKIKSILNKQIPAGSHQVEFDARDLSSGVYLYRIKAGEYQQVKKMVLLH